jgi:CheY-like chemotaxis protein
MRAKILIVDDSATSLMWHKLVLRQGPYDVVTATDGEAGVAVAAAEKPDLILMDVVMPKMDGIEAYRAIRALPGLGDVPIVMVSTPNELKTVESAFVGGGCDYVVKPVDRAELLAKIESCLGVHPVAVAS